MKKKSSPSGFKIVLFLIFIIFGGAALLSNGIFPTATKTPSNETDVENIPIAPSSSGSSQSLQLKPIQFQQKQCGQTLAVDFLLDRSGSMQGDKIQKLKNGVLLFTKGLADNSVIGAQDFSSPDSPKGTVETLIPISYYKDIKSRVPSMIASLQASGWTYTRDAFSFTSQRLNEGIQKYPGYKFALIFISDGVPETAQCPRLSQLTGKCTSNQIPTLPPSIPDAIKAKGVRIFTIAYLDQNDTSWNNQLETLMRNVASTPSDFYIAPSSNQVDSILSQIATKLCQ